MTKTGKVEGIRMQIRIENSDVILLLPKDYARVENGSELYGEMYHKRKAEDIEMFQNLASESYGNVVVSHISKKDAMSFDEAIEEIEAESGSHFDPKLVEVFLKEKETIKEKSGLLK